MTTEATPTATPEATIAQVATGIEYRETFTLREAYDSWNATREDSTNDRGEVVTAEQQRVKLAPSWFEKHAGSFTLRRAGFMEDLAMDVRFAELSRGAKLSLLVAWKIEAVTIVETCLVKAPEWFDLGGDLDPNVLYLIHHWYRSWSARFRG